MRTGTERIEIERNEQFHKHGRHFYYDKEYNKDGQLHQAAVALLYENADDFKTDIFYKDGLPRFDNLLPDGWDVDIFNKMMSKPKSERLILSAALLAAEYDRLMVYHPGDKVSYFNGTSWENGIFKSYSDYSDQLAFVTFSFNANPENYLKYTGASTHVNKLEYGWK